MKNFLLIINFLFLFSGCIAIKTLNLKKTGEKIIYANEIASLNKIRETLLYKSSIDVANLHYSGILLLKSSDSASHAVMVTELGIKLFDLEIQKDTSRFVYVFEAISKPSIRHLIGEEMKLILQHDLEGKNATVYSNEEKGEVVYRIKANKKNHLCYMLKNTNLTARINQYAAFSKINEAEFLNYENKIPRNINLKHYGIHMEIELTRLDNSENGK